jgi:hypothetical protein
MTFTACFPIEGGLNDVAITWFLLPVKWKQTARLSNFYLVCTVYRQNYYRFTSNLYLVIAKLIQTSMGSYAVYFRKWFGVYFAAKEHVSFMIFMNEGGWGICLPWYFHCTHTIVMVKVLLYFQFDSVKMT